VRSAQPDYDRDVASFDRRAKSYERSLTQGFFFGPIQKRVLDLAGSLPESSTVLDVGCGTGRLLRAAAERWPKAQLFGVDPAAKMIEVARKLNPHALFHVAPADAIPLPDGSVSIAFTTLSFHHWADQLAGVKEVCRVLRPGGRFILADVCLPDLLRWLLGNLHRSSSPAVLRGLFEQAGLTVSSEFRMMSGFISVLQGTKA
jgi:ubiquinone/menaquinone biosynthesis C-methylase UbiE